MKKTPKVLIIAGSLVLLGCIVFVCVMSALKWDFTKLSTAEYETNITEIDEEFGSISVFTETANIKLALSEDGKCKVECREEQKSMHKVAVENDTLTVKIDNRKEWYDYIGFGFGEQRITIYLPKTEYAALFIEGKTGNVEIPKNYSFESADISLTTGNVDFYASVAGAVKIKTTTGNVKAENNSVGSLEISVTTGRVNVFGINCVGGVTVGVSTGNAYLTNISCGSFISTGSTGDITLDKVLANEKISVERSTGNVKFIASDAAELYVKTSTGNVTGSLVTAKNFVTKTSAGKINVPDTTSGGLCEIRTSTGNIKITIESV